MRTLRDLGDQRARATFVGREPELAILLGLLEEDGPLVVFVHGIAGIGKTSLLGAFSERARDRGASVIRIDCAEIEPTDRGFLSALTRALGGGDDADPLARLAALPSRVILALDTYEAFRISDAWIRRVLLPGLPGNVRAVIAGREPPSLAWFGALGWAGALSVLELGPLDDAEIQAFARALGLPAGAAARLAHAARGYPLALRLAAATSVEPALDSAVAQRALDELAERYLADVDALTRSALEAAAVVRRVTLPLLGVMLPDLAPQDAFERLRALPFMSPALDGLAMHATLQDAITRRLKRQDPGRHLRYRQAAWKELVEQARGVSRSELWRYTADMLYLIENEIIREAFFPAGRHAYTVEAATPEDRPALLETIARHEGPESTAVAHAWLAAAPEVFRVARARDGLVGGHTQLFEFRSMGDRALPADPVLRAWRRHLSEDPVRPTDLVLFARRTLDREHGEAPGPVQAAIFLDVKRLYMELRPRLRRIYSGGYREHEWLGALGPLGFVPVPSADVILDGRPFRTIMLDFGPGSVDEWLARVAASELGLIEADLLDVDAREIVLGDERVPLTRLEFDLLRYLMLREGKAVPRTDLLADVWGYQYEGDSNVIEVAIRALRKKLGPCSTMLETVRGVGYRFRRA